MTQNDIKDFDSQICNRWRGKFNRQELDRWFQALQKWPLQEVVEALIKFKDHSRYVPKLTEITKLLPAQIVAPSDKPEPTFSEVIRRNSPQLRDAGFIEVLMRYWRQEWWRYKADSDARCDAAEKMAPMAAKRAGTTVDLFLASKASVAADAFRRKQYEGALSRCLNGCATSLAAEGVLVAHSEDYAAWIETGPDQFRVFLSEIRGTLAL